MPQLNTAAIEARLAAATPGPWRTGLAKYFQDLIHDTDGDYLIAAVRGFEINPERAIANRDLIAHAPTDLRALMDEVQRLRELVQDAYNEGYSDADVGNGSALDWSWSRSETRARLEGPTP